MDKYYLAKLDPAAELDQAQWPAVRLVEIQYERKPASFGVVYLASVNGAAGGARQQQLCLATMDLADKSSAQFSTTKRISLEPDSSAWSLLVDFDACKSILIDEGSTATSRQQPQCILLGQDGSLFGANFIDGGVKRLASGCQASWSSSAGQLRTRAAYVQCKLHHMEKSLERDNTCYIHLLSETHYYLYRLSARFNALKGDNNLEFISSYSLTKSDIASHHRRLMRMYTIEANEHVVILELDDFTLRILRQAACRSELAPSEHERPMLERVVVHNLNRQARQHICVLTGNCPDEVMLLSLIGTRLVAHSLLMSFPTNEQPLEGNDDGDERRNEHTFLNVNKQNLKDPDNLLEREPSFELEQCWSLDLKEIDSIRSLDESFGEFSGHQNSQEHLLEFGGEEGDGKLPTCCGCLCPVWSNYQLNQENCWPKFLLLAYKCHILAYSFEQRPQLPFSLVYDSSFLNLATGSVQQVGGESPPPLLLAAHQPASGNKSDHASYQEHVDVKVKPKLLHNFKLIGAQASDAPFNSIFLGANSTSLAYLVQFRQFAQLGLLVGLTNSAHLIGLKLTSNSKLLSQKDSLYQQLVAESLSNGETLLREAIRDLEKENSQLRGRLRKLEANRGQFLATLEDRLHSLMLAQLEQQPHLGSLYHLSMKVPELAGQVSRIIVVSTVNSYILEPISTSGVSFNSLTVENDNLSRVGSERAYLLANVSLGERKGEKEEIETAQRTLTDLEQLLRTDSSEAPVIHTWAVLELAASATGPASLKRSAAIRLPMFIMEGQFGRVDVFYTLVGGGEAPMDSMPQSLTSRPSKMDALRLPTNNSDRWFHAQSIAIKPLMSYELVAPVQAGKDHFLIGGNVSETKPPSMTITITGPMKGAKFAAWLMECLRFLPDGENFSNLNLKFASPFTCCSLECAISEGQCVLASDDMFALELIKRHLLNGATNESIKLEVSVRSANASKEQILSRLIGLQERNLRLLISPANFIGGQNLASSSKGRASIETQAGQEEDELLESLLENLITELTVAQINSSLPSATRPPSNDALERALREDIEQLLRAKSNDQATRAIGKRKSGSFEGGKQASVFKDLVCGYIVDMLVDFDKFHGLKQASSEAMERMRTRLMEIIQEPALSWNHFPDRIISEWRLLINRILGGPFLPALPRRVRRGLFAKAAPVSRRLIKLSIRPRSASSPFISLLDILWN